MFTLQVITASTREGRQGPIIADWFIKEAEKHAKFIIEPIDLKQVNLPMFDEPNHPRMQNYVNDHTKAWSETIQRADAFVFVTCEYNHSAPPSLINAIDYLGIEWSYKPVGFVSYGGLSGGTRGVEGMLSILTTLMMMPLPIAVNLPFYTQYIDEETGLFDPGERQAEASTRMLDELLRWTNALQVLRD